MIERTRNRFGLWPERLAGDTGYGSAEMLAWLVHEQGIEPHVPVFDKSGRTDGTFSRADFTYDRKTDTYTCPGGNTLVTRGTVGGDNEIRYRASKYDCTPCALKARCCPKEPVRKVARSIHEGARDMRGPNGAQDEFLLAATAQNLRRLAKLVMPAGPIPAT